MSLKHILRTSFYTTAIAAFVSGNPFHMGDREAGSENGITPSTSDTLINWSVITDSAPNEQKSFLLLLNETGTEGTLPVHFITSKNVLKGEPLNSDDPQLATAEVACSFLKQIWIL